MYWYRIGVEGSPVIATSQFIVTYVPSEKHTESFEYSCERPVMKERTSPAKLKICNGTKIFMR